MVEKISAGSFDLNKWLYGGYEKDVITMIAGSPGSGKTNLCLLAACSQAKKGKKVIFMDTEGGFSSERVKQIVGEEHKTVLENILLLSPVDFNEQNKLFKTLLEKVKSEHVSLIIIDGMAMLYRIEMGDAIESEDEQKITEINRQVATQMRILAEIARKKNIPVLITNQVYKKFVSSEDWIKGIKGESNIVGGDLFKYWSKCIIELEKEGSKRTALLIKHRSLPEKQFGFVIRNTGIFKRGWI